MKSRIRGLLSKGSKKIGIDLVYIAKGGSWLTLARGTAILTSFLVTIVLTSLLPKETFGQYRFVLSVIPFLSLFSLPGITTALTRSVAQGHAIDLVHIAKTKITWGVLGMLASWSVALYYFLHENILLAHIFGITGFFIPFFETFLLYAPYYKGKKQYKLPSLYECAVQIIHACVLGGTVLFTHNIVLIIAAYFGGQIVTRFIFFTQTLKNIRREMQNNRLEETIDKNIISYGKELSGAKILGIISKNIDTLLVWHFGGAIYLAVYVVVLTIPGAINNALSFLPEIAFPKFTHIDFSLRTARTRLYRQLGLFTLALIGITVLYVPLVTYLFPVIFPSYASSLLFAYFAAPLIILFPVRSILEQVFFASGNITFTITFKIVGILAQLILFFASMPYFSHILIGALFAYIGKNVFIIGTQIILLHRWNRTHY